MADDDAGNRRILQRTLEGAGYEVIVCASGEEALEAWKLHHASIALVLLDMIMPGLGGAEVLQRMVDIAPPPAALIVSGYLGDTMALADTGVPTQTLTKPWRRKVLLRRVADLLEEHG